MGQEALSGKGHLQDFLLTAAPDFSWHFLSLPLSSFRSEPGSASFAVLQNDRRHIRYTQLLRLQTYFIFPHPHLGCRLNFNFLYYVSETFRLQASCYFAINKKTTLFTLLATPAFSTSSLPLNLFRHCVSWFRKTCACFQDFLIRQKKKRPPVVLLMQEDTINKYNFVLKINGGGGKEKKKDARNKMSRTPKLIFTRFVSLKHIITNTENKELNSLHVV